MRWALPFSCLLACSLGFPRSVRHPAASSSLAYTRDIYHTEGQNPVALNVATTSIPSSDQGEKEKNEYLNSIFHAGNTVTPSTLILNNTSLVDMFPSPRSGRNIMGAAASTMTKASVRKNTKGSASYIRSINKQIDIYLPPKNTLVHTSSVSASELRSYLNANRDHVDKVHVLTVMYRCAKLGRPDLSSFIDLGLIVSTLNTIEEQSIQFRSVATALYSLHVLNIQDKDQEKEKYHLYIRDIVNIVSRWLVDMKESDQIHVTGQAIAMCVVGLKQMDINNEDVKILIQSLNSIIRSSKTTMNAHDVASALYGLQNMDCAAHEELDMLLGEIVSMMESSVDFRGDRRLSSKHFSMILYGLHSSSSDSR